MSKEEIRLARELIYAFKKNCPSVTSRVSYELFCLDYHLYDIWCQVLEGIEHPL